MYCCKSPTPVQPPKLDVLDDHLELDLAWKSLEEASNIAEPAPTMHAEIVGHDEESLVLDNMADLPPDFFSQWDAGDEVVQTTAKTPVR